MSNTVRNHKIEIWQDILGRTVMYENVKKWVSRI